MLFHSPKGVLIKYKQYFHLFIFPRQNKFYPQFTFPRKKPLSRSRVMNVGTSDFRSIHVNKSALGLFVFRVCFRHLPVSTHPTGSLSGRGRTTNVTAVLELTGYITPKASIISAIRNLRRCIITAVVELYVI